MNWDNSEVNVSNVLFVRIPPPNYSEIKKFKKINKI